MDEFQLVICVRFDKRSGTVEWYAGSAPVLIASDLWDSGTYNLSSGHLAPADSLLAWLWAKTDEWSRSSSATNS
jgi:hypothetical protein